MGYSNQWAQAFNSPFYVNVPTGGPFLSISQDPTNFGTSVSWNFILDTGSKYIAGFNLFFVDVAFGFSTVGLSVGPGPTLAIDANGNIGDGTSIGNFSQLKINGTTKIDANGYTSILNATPATSGAAGVKGQTSFDGNYLYICTATNTWKRVALSAF